MRDKKALINSLKKLMNPQKKLKNQRLLGEKQFLEDKDFSAFIFLNLKPIYKRRIENIETG